VNVSACVMFCLAWRVNSLGVYVLVSIYNLLSTFCHFTAHKNAFIMQQITNDVQ